MKQECTKDWACLLPWAVVTVNCHRSSSTGYTPQKLFPGGRHAWFFKAPFCEDYKSPVEDFAATKAGPGQHSQG